MIRKLRLKFSLLVLCGLLVITTGIVFSINYVNHLSLQRQVDTSLQILTEGGGQRPGLRQREQMEGAVLPDRGEELVPAPGQEEHFRQMASGPEFAANLANSYTVLLDQEGNILKWFSDREDLYSDQQIQEMAAYALAEGEDAGHLGSQYYRLTQQPDGALLVVLDTRLEQENAQQLLLISTVAGLVAYLLMSLGAVVLIRRMTRPVQEAFDRQKQFVMDASHELKTPLSVISANAEALAGEIGENQWLGYIQSEVRRTDHLVQDLLTMARMDRGGLQPQRETFDLSRAVLSVALPFESAAFDAGKTLQLEVQDDVLYNGDQEKLKQLTVILLGNAMKYADPGGAITLSLSAKGDRRILKVHNTGEGISREDLPHIFDRFYRADRARSRETEGYGLGLSIAKTIVEEHRGKITAESQPGQWACFTVTL